MRRFEAPRFDTGDPGNLPEAAGGLTSAEARRRLEEFGANELPERRPTALRKVLAYFRGPIAWMIEVAVLLSLVVRDWTDFGIILALLVADAGIAVSGATAAARAAAAIVLMTPCLAVIRA